ncbi:MAG: hypothetical protein CBC13_03365 [Planctomycetia bacterium TMED53]|nr:MAG: hypothetical protein CBC13_03365 [Planctomycetia bacterium TMED53]
MVYFGPKHYRPPRVGPSNRERFRILGSFALLLALVFTVWSTSEREPESASEVPLLQPVESGEGLSPNVGDSSALDSTVSGGEVPEPVSLPRPEADPQAEPFVENPQILSAVRDEEAVVEGPSELAGLYYLLHRWRSDWKAEEVTEPPEVQELRTQADEVRGRRYNFVVSLIENPRLRELEENPSGLTQIWEAFGADRSNRLHRINFIGKPKSLPRGSEVVVTGDFLRLYRYETLTGKQGMVPEWVSGKLEPYESPFAGRSGWDSQIFWILSGLAAVTLLIGLFFISRSFSPTGSRKTAR